MDADLPIALTSARPRYDRDPRSPDLGPPPSPMAPIRDSIEDDHVRPPLDGPGPRPGAVRGPGTGPVGGRAAMRAERQAADMARRKAGKRTGSAVAVLDELDPDTAVRKPRRVVKGLLAMTVVALGVLGVYSSSRPRRGGGLGDRPADARPPPRCSPRRPRSRAGDRAARGRTRADDAGPRAGHGPQRHRDHRTGREDRRDLRRRRLGVPGRRCVHRRRRRRLHGVLHRGRRDPAAGGLQLIDAVPAAAGPDAAVLRAAGRRSPPPASSSSLAGDWQP